VDFVLQSRDRLLAVEVKASRAAHRTDARALEEFLRNARIPGLGHGALRLGLIVTRGREVEPVALGVWAVPDWRLFGPAE
jgi:predicted AAA+ superfamily ATPase